MSSRSLMRGRMQEIAAVVPPMDVDTVGMGCTDFTVAAWVRTVSIAFFHLRLAVRQNGLVLFFCPR